MKLYNFRFGPYPRRISIYFAEKGLRPSELIEFDPPSELSGWPPSSIQDLTPTGSLPILVDDDGTVVSQSLAILEYLEDTRPIPDMRGATPAERVSSRQLVNVLDTALTFFALWARHGSALSRTKPDDSRDLIEIGAQGYFDQLRLTERMIGDTEFLAGDATTIADCVGMALLQYTIEFYDVPIPPDCHRLSSWYDRFSGRPSAAGSEFPAEQHRIARGLLAQSNVSIHSP